jgi:hypothetical protein
MEVEEVQNQISEIMKINDVTHEVKKMFGGICFMVEHKMCLGIHKAKNMKHPKLIARVGEYFYQEALERAFCEPFDLTGRPMRGFVFVEEEGFDNQEDLGFWVKKCLEFNPQANKK